MGSRMDSGTASMRSSGAEFFLPCALDRFQTPHPWGLGTPGLEPGVFLKDRSKAGNRNARIGFGKHRHA